MIRNRRLRRFVNDAQNRLTGFPTRRALESRGMVIGPGTYLGPKVAVDGQWCFLITIGRDVTIAPGARLLAHDASMRRATGLTVIARTTVQDGAYIGSGAVIGCGVTVGSRAVVGAGAVVRRDVPPGMVVAGNPATEWGTVEALAERHSARASAGTVLPDRGWTVPGGLDDHGKSLLLEMLDRGPVYIQ